MPPAILSEAETLGFPVFEVPYDVPFIAIILLACLQVIPTEIYEAANMDGANWRQSFRRLTLPLLIQFTFHSRNSGRSEKLTR